MFYRSVVITSIAVVIGIFIPKLVLADCACEVTFSAEQTVAGAKKTCSGKFSQTIPGDGTVRGDTLFGLMISSVASSCSSEMPGTLGDAAQVPTLLKPAVAWSAFSKQVVDSNCTSLSTAGDLTTKLAGDITFVYGGVCKVSVHEYTISNEDVAGRYNALNQFRNVGTDAQFSISVIIGRLIYFSLTFIGSVALILFIYAGFTWMVQGGNAEAEKKAASIMVWAVLGLAVVLGSYGIVQFIFSAFPTTSSPASPNTATTGGGIDALTGGR